MRIIVRMLVVSLLATATALQAITYIVPNDRDLVRRSEAIVIATALESHSQYTTDGRIVTIATMSLGEVIKGELGGQSSIDLTEAGGFVGDHATAIPGSPRYAAGKQYMVFMRRTTDGWATYGFSLGKFEFVSDLNGRQILTRGGSDEIFGWDEMTNASHVETLRDAIGFQTFIRTVMASADAPARADYFVDRGAVVLQSQLSFTPKPLAGFTRPDYLMTGNVRWQSPTANFDYCCSPFTVPGGLDGPGGIAAGTGNWTGAGAGVHYGVGAANPAATHGLVSADGVNAVLFNDPSDQVPAGVAAIGGISNATGTYNTLGDGFTYFNTVEVDVVVGKSFSTNQATFNGVMTHEIGHTLGFRHSDQNADSNGPCVSPSPCTSNAIMNHIIAFNQQTLLQWDLDAVQTVYGSGPVCNAPAVTTQPASQSIASGSQANLSVAASGTAPLTYQWYIGTSGTTTTPVNGATSTTFNPSPTTTTNYWVRVSGCSLTANSNTAVVTVTCAPPSAPAPIASPSTIASGQSSTVSETPTGTGSFTYQWFAGNSGVTTSPIGGATNSSVNVSPTTTTSYWVRVTGQCAPTADSPAAVVTVAPCVPPSAPVPIASPSSIPNGQSSTIFVSPSGTSPFTYQWYAGTSGVTTSPIGGATNSFVTVSPTVTTSYWVRVTGQCSPAADSRETTVTVTCSPISPSGVTAQPSTVNSGQSSTLFFSTAGTGPFTIQWYTGGQGDTSNPIAGATSTSTVVSPVGTTGYWVHVTALCGSQDGSVVVFVNGAPCIAPSITTQPASSNISAGSSVTLTVAASGTAPFTFQWYAGDKGDVSHPLAGATLSSTTQSPAATTKYWARVSNSCNGTQSADSNAATITVPTCTNPSITTQPANVSAPIGTAATLHVVAAGTAPLHYQWFQGVKGDTSKPAGIDSATFVSGAISSNTSFWVHVTGQCGNPADSNAATVTATAAPRRRAARH
jgi:Dual-action HEIGH metallo-peptidase.